MMEQAGRLARNLWIAAAACAVALILSSCAAEPASGKAAGPLAAQHSEATAVSPDADLSSLDGTFWRLARLDGSGRTPSDAVLRVTRGAVDISQPEWVVSFPFRAEASGLAFFPASSRTGTAEGQVSTLFERALHGTIRYRIEGERLSFLDNGGRPLITADLIHPDGPENRNWLVVLYRRDGMLVRPNSTVPPSVTFLNGIVDGSPGCGGLIGSYHRSGGRLEILTMWLLAGACAQSDFAESNNATVDALNGQRRADVSGDRMWLKDEAGAVQAELAAAPVPALSTIGSRRPPGG